MFDRNSAAGKPWKPLEVQPRGNGNISLLNIWELQQHTRPDLPPALPSLRIFIRIFYRLKKLSKFLKFFIHSVLICKDCGTVLYGIDYKNSFKSQATKKMIFRLCSMLTNE